MTSALLTVANDTALQCARKLEFAIFIYPFITRFSSVFEVANAKINKLCRVYKGNS